MKSKVFFITVLFFALSCSNKTRTDPSTPDFGFVKPEIDPGLLNVPTLLKPYNNRTISFFNKKEIAFNWSEIKTEPNKSIFYIISINKSEIYSEERNKYVRLTTVYSDTILNRTSLIVSTDKLQVSEKENIKNEYVWTVQAIDSDGIPVCKSNCQSPEFRFYLLLSPSDPCEIEVTVIDISCARPAYDLTFSPPKVNYQISFLVKNNGSITMEWWKHFGTPSMPNDSPPINPSDQFSLYSNAGNISILSMTPAILPATLGSGASQQITMIFSVPLGATTLFLIPHLQHPVDNFEGEPICKYDQQEIIPLPDCICDPCKIFSINWPPEPPWTFCHAGQVTQSTNPDLDLFIVDDQAFVSPNAIIKIQAEIVGFYHGYYPNTNNDCESCNRANQSHAEFVGSNNTLTGNWQNNGSPVDFLDLSSDLESMGVFWVSNSSSGNNISGGVPIHLEIGIPNLHSCAKCCGDCFFVMVRYTFIDKNCNACESVRFYCGCR